MTLENYESPDLNSILEPYFFFSINSRAELLYVSPSIEQVLGFQPNEVIGRRFFDFLDGTSPLNSEIPDCETFQYVKGKNHHLLRIVETRDQSLVVLNVQTYGQHDVTGRLLAHHGIAQDVSDFYFAEQEMHRRLIELQKTDNELTDRERFVLDRVNVGIPNKVIAKRLDITERSVEKIRSRLVKKFGTQSMVEVVVKSTELRLLQEVTGLARNVHSGHSGPAKPTSRLLARNAQANKTMPKDGNPN